MQATPTELQLEEASSPLKLDTLPPEIIQLIFDAAGKGTESSSHVDLCLISRFLRPFGEAVLYRDVNLVKQYNSYTSMLAGSVSSNRTISFIEELLPNLKAPQVRAFSLLILDLASAPPSWVMQRLRQLLRRFRTSKAVLKIYIAPKAFTKDLFALFTSTERHAFATVTIEVVNSGQGDPSESLHSSIQAPYRMCDIVMVSMVNSDITTRHCSIWTQYGSTMWYMPVSADRTLYFVGPWLLFVGPRQTQRWSLSQKVAEMNDWESLSVVSALRDKDTLAFVASFDNISRLRLNLSTSRSAELPEPLETVQAIKTPDSTTQLKIEWATTRPSLADLITLLKDPDWVPSIKDFEWSYRDTTGAVGATKEELQLIEAGVSWYDNMAQALDERDAQLWLHDGQVYQRVCPRAVAGGEEDDK